MKSFSYKHSRNTGFTILETLVAITVLMMVIVGPLTAANKGLNLALSARDQLTASLLAQDVAEYVKNLKDVNIATNASGGWLEGINICTINNLCLLDSTRPLGTGISLCNSSNVDSCFVYLDATGYRQPAPANSNRTLFNRGFYITQQGSVNQRKVYVLVSWISGGVRYESTLTAGIANINW